MTLSLNLSDLRGADRCKGLRSFNYEFRDGKSMALEEAIAKKKVLADLLFGRSINAYKAMEAAMSDIEFQNEQQKKDRIYDAARYASRYASNEKRIPMQPPYKVVNLSPGVTVKIKPDYLFFRMNDGEPVFEVVRFHFSKPQFSQRSADKGEADALEVYALLKYAEEITRGMKGVYHLKASVYYGRYMTDKRGTSTRPESFDSSFFNAQGAGNIVSLMEKRYGSMNVLYYWDTNLRTGIKKPVKMRSWDEAFADSVASVAAGIEKEDCKEADCEKCPLHDACKYTASPLAITKEAVTKSIRSLSLSANQKQAINVDKGIWRINAGAGVGKTLVIALRAVTLLNKGVAPEDILLITFTNAGAEEMRGRIQVYYDDLGDGEDISGMRIMTYNAFGDMILKKEYKSLGFTAEPKVIDANERNRIITDLLAKHPVEGLDYRNFTVNMKTCRGALATAGKIFEIMKKRGLYFTSDAEAVRKELAENMYYVARYTVENVMNLFPEFDKKLHEENLIEFVDQEGMVFDILHSDPFYLEQFGIRHIIVDEFQDSNQGQIDLLRMLVDTPSFESLMVVGDDSQSIYGFRDTSPKYIIDFESYIGADTEDINLLENHRSQEKIIDFANKINAMNTKRVMKDLIATRPAGKDVEVKGFFTSDEEIEYVKSGIKEHLEAGVKPEDIAVICYSKPELLKMADVLQKEGIPSVMMNPELLMDNSRVRAAIAMVKVLQDFGDTKDLLTYAEARERAEGNSLLGASEKEIHEATEDALMHLKKIAGLPEMAKKEKILEAMTKINTHDDEVYQSFVDTISFKPTVEKIYQYCNDFYVFGAETAVRRNHSYPGVVLITAHSSKGLEWPVVYNMISKYDTEELHNGTTRAVENTEERRRLLFVSATRARDELYITSQFVAFSEKDPSNPKNRKYTHNLFLKNAYSAVGVKLTDELISGLKADHDLNKKKAKSAKQA